MFNFYGDGPHLHQLKYFVGKNELKNVKFHGHIDNVTDVWKANHILILPSRMEGQSVSLSEALAFSRTVVATNVGGVSEFLTDNVTGFISEDVTISSFENAMERMWKRKDKLEKIGKEAHLSWVKKVPKDPIEYIINLLQLH
jgi:glycosyltransferase involved in cell wall biosynthesis